MICNSVETTVILWFQPAIIGIVNNTSPQWPHILASGTFPSHPSILSHPLFRYFLPCIRPSLQRGILRSPVTANYTERSPPFPLPAECCALCITVCASVKHCGCADLQLWPNLSQKWICTSWVIPTHDPTVQNVQLCLVLPTFTPYSSSLPPPSPITLHYSPSEALLLWWMLNGATAFFFILYGSILFEPPPLFKPSYHLTVPAFPL